MKKLFTFLCLLMLGAGMSVQAQMVVKWGDSDNYDISVEITDDTDNHESIYLWGSEGSEYFVKISAVDKNKLSTNTNFAELEMYIHIGENSGNTRTYNDGNGGTFQGPKVNEEGYPIIVPYLKYQNYYYYVDQAASAEYVVGYAREKGSYGYGRCNQSSFYRKTNGLGMASVTQGRVVVKEGKNGTMFLAHYNNSNELVCAIGEETPEDGTITAVSNDNSKGTVSGIVVGSGADFASGTEYEAETQITLNASALSGYTFLKWNEDSNTENPRTITVNGNATYTAVFAPTHTITVNSADASKGTATGGGLYAEGATVKISAIGNDGYVFTQWSDGNTDNPRTITVSSDGAYTAQFAVETASWGSYSYDNANDIIQVDIAGGADNICESYWSPYGGDFMCIICANHTKTTSNYVQLYFKTNTTDYTYPDGRLGIAPGTYVTTTPNEVTNWCGNNLYWFWNWDAIPWEGAVAYTYSSEIGLNDQSCYAADVNYSGNSPSFTQRYKIGNYNDGTEAKIIVAEGKDGHMYVQVREVVDNTLLVSIGEPAPSVSNSTATLTPPTNGTITLHNDDTDADVVFTENAATIADGTTLTITANGITGYHCTGITVNDEPLVGSTYTVDGDFVIAATFAPNTNTAYTVKHYQQNLTLDGYTEVEGDRQNLTGTTAASTAAVAQTYTGFTAQSFEQGTIAGDGSTVVSIYYNRDKYTVSLAVSPADYGTVSQESVTDVPYGAVIAIGTDENANKVTINGIPVTAAMEFYSFVEWQNTTSVDPVSLSAGSSFNLSGAVSLTAVFELPETIVLRDDFENNSRWQTDYAALRTTLTVNGKVAKRDVQLKRTFNAGRWSTISLPFAYNFSKQGNNTFKGQVYYLISAKYTEQGYLKLNCMPNTYRIEPNKPYIVIPNETIVNPVFNDVTLQSIGDGSYTVENTENIGTGVTFRNTQYRQTLPNNDKRVIYLSSNTLCYPNPEKETYMNAFRGYFYLNVEVGDIHYIQPRRVILETTDGDRIEYAEESNEAISSETHKYIENGILVIERNGIKYDAQGHIIK